MRKARAIFLLLVVVGGNAYAGALWLLSDDCAGPELSLSVLFDDAEVFESRGPACASDTDNADGKWKTSTLSVNFEPRQAITWAGYRDEPFDSPKGASLIVDLWLAGADNDRNIWYIGVSVRDDDSIYMNTVHVADLASTSELCLGNGFCVRTRLGRSANRR